jgi:hypothetical protein
MFAQRRSPVCFGVSDIMQYIDTWSLALDWKILLRTIPRADGQRSQLNERYGAGRPKPRGPLEWVARQ